MYKVKISTELWLDEKLDIEEKVKEEFEELAWENNRKDTQPNVKIERID